MSKINLQKRTSNEVVAVAAPNEPRTHRQMDPRVRQPYAGCLYPEIMAEAKGKLSWMNHQMSVIEESERTIRSLRRMQTQMKITMAENVIVDLEIGIRVRIDDLKRDLDLGKE